MQRIKHGMAPAMLALGTFAFGCAGGTLPSEKLASAEASVKAARELGAASVPRAELHLRLAQEEVQQAEQCAKDGDEARGKVLLDRARADAELAMALTRQNEAQNALEAQTGNEVSLSDPQAQTSAP